jgi:hypothetical protein
MSIIKPFVALNEALINSMNGGDASKITNACVSKLSNSGAIICE